VRFSFTPLTYSGLSHEVFERDRPGSTPYTDAMEQDIRWKQRFANFKKAFARLAAGVELARSRQLTDLEQQGLIQAFEFTHELAWNVLKDWFEDQGNSALTGSKDATREAFARGLIVEGQVWMDMIKSRNLSSHTYNAETADLLTAKILGSYCHEFASFQETMGKRTGS